jgi:hypothetical protein
MPAPPLCKSQEQIIFQSIYSTPTVDDHGLVYGAPNRQHVHRVNNNLDLASNPTSLTFLKLLLVPTKRERERDVYTLCCLAVWVLRCFAAGFRLGAKGGAKQVRREGACAAAEEYT